MEHTDLAVNTNFNNDKLALVNQSDSESGDNGILYGTSAVNIDSDPRFESKKFNPNAQTQAVINAEEEALNSKASFDKGMLIWM